MKQINLKTTSRTQVGGNSAKRYRKSGQVPAVIYGESGEKNLLIDAKELSVALKSVIGKAVLIDMSFSDGTESRYAMVKAVDRHPITDQPIHVDFVEVVRGKPMHAVLPLHFKGEAEAYGVKNENGVIEIHEREVRVRCRPRDLPEMIEIDVTSLKVGEALHLKDVVPPTGVEFTENPDMLLVTCDLVKEEVPETPAPEAEAAEGAAAPAAAAKAAAPAAEEKKSK